MSGYTTNDLRNVTIVGHGGSGKTSLCDAILHTTGVTNRLGSVSDKTSHLDTDDEEKDRGYSIESHVLHVNKDGKVLNLIDTPGAPDFIGPAIATLAAVETALVVVHAAAGIQVNTRRMMDQAHQFGLARAIVINRIDAENADLEGVLTALQETFGPEITPVNLPAGGGKSVVDCIVNDKGDADFGGIAEVHTNIVERVAEVDDALMNKYFDQGSLSADEIRAHLPAAIARGTIVPVLFTNARTGIGVQELLTFIASSCPSPAAGKQRMLKVGDEEKPIDPAGPFCGLVFKIAIDPRSNIKYSFIRCLGGTLRSDNTLLLPGEKKGMRPGHLLKFQGVDQTEIEDGICGEVFAVAKLDLHIGNTVFSETHEGSLAMPKFPTPMFSLAIEPKARGDEGKIGDAVRRFADIDPCFKSTQDAQTGELVISGVGDMHLRVVLSRMVRQFKLDVNTKPPKIPYRETITTIADGHYRHKKQTGGAGQFGEVFLRVEPAERGGGYEFVDELFGESIPRQFLPAIEKGVLDVMHSGAIAGYPLQDIKVFITDGKHHPVDSKEVAFRTAGKYAFIDAIHKAKPVILEPIVNLEVTIPASYMGDITGDLSGRRGRILGQDVLPGGQCVIKAQAPLAEVMQYNSQLRSVTGGQGSYSMELSHYEPVPGQVQQQIIASATKAKEEDKDK